MRKNITKTRKILIMKTTKVNQIVKPITAGGSKQPPGGGRKIDIAAGEAPRDSRTLDLFPKSRDKEDSKDSLSSDKELNTQSIEIIEKDSSERKAHEEELLRQSQIQFSDEIPYASACTTERTALSQRNEQNQSQSYIGATLEYDPVLRLRGGGGTAVTDPLEKQTHLRILLV